MKTEPAPGPPRVAPQNARLLWVLPNYTTVEEREQFTPLSTATKFKLSAKTMTDPVTVFFIGGIALLGQARNSDPSQGSKWHRGLYSASRIFVARSDHGELQFNYSEIVGNAVAAGISNTYHPQSQRRLGNTISIWGTDTMLNMICKLAKEFWPDIRRKLRKQREAK